MDGTKPIPPDTQIAENQLRSTTKENKKSMKTGKTFTHFAVAAIAACAAFAATADKKQFSALDGEEAKRVKTHNLDGSPVVCESVAAVEGCEASLLPKGRQFKLVWNDEFLVDFVRVYDIIK